MSYSWSKWKSPFQLFSIRGQLPVDKHDGRSARLQHSWLEMSKTSHREESCGTDRFTFVWPWSVSAAALSAARMGSTFLFFFFHQMEVVGRVYNGPTLLCDCALKASVPSDMIERAQRNKAQLLSLPHFSAGYPVACWCSGFYSWSNSQRHIM